MAISEVTKDLRMYPYYATLDGIGFGGMSDFPSKLEVSIIYSTDDYTFKTPRTPEEILEVLGRREEK